MTYAPFSYTNVFLSSLNHPLQPPRYFLHCERDFFPTGIGDADGNYHLSWQPHVTSWRHAPSQGCSCRKMTLQSSSQHELSHSSYSPPTSTLVSIALLQLRLSIGIYKTINSIATSIIASSSPQPKPFVKISVAPNRRATVVFASSKYQPLPRSTIGKTDHLQVARKRPRRTHQSLPQSNTSQNRPFRFLDLPSEVRNMVYGYLVVSPSSIHPYFRDQTAGAHSNPINTALLAASRQINHESTAIFSLKNAGTICNRHHRGLVRHCTSSPPFRRGPNDWVLTPQDRHLKRGLTSLADEVARSDLTKRDHKQQQLLRIKALKDDMFWHMISRLHRVLIKVNWIDTKRVRTYVHHRCIWVSYERPLIHMLRPFRDLVMRGEANMLNTVVISFR